MPPLSILNSAPSLAPPQPSGNSPTGRPVNLVQQQPSGSRPLTWQSKRSVTPPWPGMESPKSLILKLQGEGAG